MDKNNIKAESVLYGKTRRFFIWLAVEIIIAIIILIIV